MGRVIERVDDVVDGRQQRLDLLNQFAALRGQVHLAAAFVEDRKTQTPFQLAHARRDGGLGRIHMVGGGLEASQLCDMAQGLQMHDI